MPPDQIEEAIARVAEAYRELAGARCVIELELRQQRDVGALFRDSFAVYGRHSCSSSC